MLSFLRSQKISGPFVLGLTTLILTSCAGFHPGIRKSAPSEGALTEGGTPPGRNVSAARMQVQVMDVSDRYVSGMWAAMDEYLRNETDPAKRVAAQSWKVLYGTSSMEIAASRDPRDSVLDMIVFISVGKWAANNWWVPKVFGEKAAGLSAVYDEMDREVWKLSESVLTPDQQGDLKKLIAAWETANPRMNEVAGVRLRNLDGVELADFEQVTSARGILASVQRLMGKVDTSLLYGERVMFYMERTPRILTQQTDLTLLQIADAFPIAALRPEGITRAVEALPAQLQKIIDENPDLAEQIVPEIRTTLESTNHLIQSLDGALQSVQDLSEQAKNSPVTSEDLSLTFDKATSALSHLDSTLGGVNQLLAKDAAGESKVMELSRLVDERVDRAMDKAFQRALILIGVFLGGLIVVLVLARILFARSKTRPTTLEQE